MRRITLLFALALVVGAGHTAHPLHARNREPTRIPTRTRPASLELPVATRELVVSFRPGVSRAVEENALEKAGAQPVDAIGRLDIRVARVPAGVSVAQALETFRDNPLVTGVEPNIVRPVAAVPDDPLFGQLWGLDNTGQDHALSNPPPATAAGTPDADIDAPEAWDTPMGSAEVVVAVLDTGVDITHPDLDANIWTNDDEVPANGIDDDLNGYVDDYNGYDFAEEDTTLLEPNASIFGWDHGTHVAGTIAAEANNATGVAGVCPNCSIMVLKGFKPFDFDGDGIKDAMGLRLSDELEALDYAARMGAHILNGSYGSEIVTSRAQRAAFVDLGRAGVLSVVAAGNANGDSDMLMPGLDLDGDRDPDSFAPGYPAAYDVSAILAVAASNHNDEYAYDTACAINEGDSEWPCTFTNWGRQSIDLAAPGVDVTSTVPGGGYATFDGTSMAAPHAAGVAAYLKSLHPQYTPRQLKSALMNSVDKPATLKTLKAFPGFIDTGNFTRTSGRLNALSTLSASTEELYPRTDGTIPGARKLVARDRGWVSWPNDVNDVYKKWLVKGRRYEVVLDGPPRPKDFDLAIYKPGTKDIWELAATCRLVGGNGPCQLRYYIATVNSADESKRFTASHTGRHFFHVTSWFSKGHYTLTVKRLH
ncbi:MAG: S8 family peptidase [Actinomycetota bacterium]